MPLSPLQLPASSVTSHKSGEESLGLLGGRCSLVGRNQAGSQGSMQPPLMPIDSLNLTKAMSSVEMALTDKGLVGNPLCGGEVLQHLASREENT